MLACGAYFGEPSDSLAERLLNEQLEDGGWNCDAPESKRSSFNSTICVLEGLLQYEQVKDDAGAVREARLRGQEYLLERKLLRSLSTGEIVEKDRKSGRDWREFTFPTRWRYDVLWGLDYLRKAGTDPDDRVSEAIDLVAEKQLENGRWPLGEPHPGTLHFDIEKREAVESRWNTLRVLRVLNWYSGKADTQGW